MGAQAVPRSVHAAAGPVAVPPARRHRWIVWAVAVLLAVTAGRAAVAEPLRVSSDSMSPTLLRGDVVLVEKLTPRLSGVERDDLVAFESPPDGRLVLKRVVGIAGDTVEMRDAALYVNGARVREPYVDHRSIDGTYFGPVRVPANTVFVLGDRRAGSIDSRAYGSVPVGALTGRVAVRLWPPVRTG